MSARLLSPADYLTMPWANGQGVTIELAREEDDNEDLLWRLSRATVDRDGPFSHFQDIDRILMLLDGPGFTLDFGEYGGIRLAEPFESAEFSGNWTTIAREVAGPSLDLNIMVAHGRARARLSVYREGHFHDRAADRSLLLAWGGPWTVELGTAAEAIPALTLADQHLLILDDQPNLSMTAQGTGALIVIDITLTP